jgi:hypothetical protein
MGFSLKRRTGLCALILHKIIRRRAGTFFQSWPHLRILYLSHKCSASLGGTLRNQHAINVFAAYKRIPWAITAGHGHSFQDDIYGVQWTWTYFQGFGKPFPVRNGTFCVVSWWCKPLKISPLQALGGILLEMSS